MKRIKILFGAIAVLYMVGTCYQMYLFLDFQSHKEEIIEAHCENKDKPEIHCDGNCHFKKEVSNSPIHASVVQEENKEIPSYAMISFDTFNEIIYSKKLNIYNEIPELLSVSLGAAETTLLSLTTAYAPFVNGGKKITPTLIDRVQDRRGKTILKHDNRTCKNCYTGSSANQIPRIASLDSRKKIISFVLQNTKHGWKSFTKQTQVL